MSPFFVENVGTLQLAALSVCRGIFCLYEKHRQIILDDIFSSLARLPSSKRNFRRYAEMVLTCLLFSIDSALQISHLSHLRIRSQSFTDQISVIYGSDLSHLRIRSQSFTDQISVIYGSDLSHLRIRSQSFTDQISVIYGSDLSHLRIRSQSFTDQISVIYGSDLSH